MVEKWLKAPSWGGISREEKKEMLKRANERSVAAFRVEPKALASAATGLLGVETNPVEDMGGQVKEKSGKQGYFVSAHT